MVWSNESNTDLLNDFEGELNKESPSNGTFKEDLDKLLADNFPDLILCPFIKCSSTSIPSKEEGGEDIIIESVKIMNCSIDRASWRLVLIACTLLNSKVKEIIVHGSELSKGHVEDLTLALSRFCSIECLKLEYVIITPEANTIPTTEEEGKKEEQKGEEESTPKEEIPESIICLGDLLKPELGIKYLSLRGCSLSSSFITNVMSKALPTTWGLEALNINNNTFDDVSMSTLIKAIAIAPTLSSISMSKCIIEKEDLEVESSSSSSSSSSSVYVSDIVGLFRGIDVTTTVTEIEEEINNANKVAGDFNKALKDTNKRRKKGNLDDLPDVIPTTIESRIIDGPPHVTGEEGAATTTEGEEVLPIKFLVNKNIKYIDGSNNTAASEDDLANALSKLCAVTTTDKESKEPEAEPEGEGEGDTGKAKIVMKLTGSGLKPTANDMAVIEKEFVLIV